ncbi:MAG: FAD:protein FMN transferase [Vicinamibacteraceae bacterium]
MTAWVGGGALSTAAGGLRGVAAIAALTLVPAFEPSIFGAAPGTAPIRVETSAPHMGTLVRIVLYADSRPAGDAAAAAAFARIDDLDARLSDYRDDSEVAALSRAAVGVAVPVSDDLFAVLASSEALARRTDGAFDVTAGRLTHLWRRARRVNAWPDAAVVAEARAAGGFAKVRLDPRRRTATLTAPGLEFDPGGIAKGYAADEALRVLRARGTGAALVAIGGDIVAGDPPPGQLAWTVAIPRLGAASADAAGAAEPHWIALVRAAVSTSGDAEQWMTVDGVRRSHVIDLRSGWPVTGRTATSVVAARGIDADAVSTALGILDAEAGARLLDTVRGPRDSGAHHHGAPPLAARPPGAQALWQRVDATGATVAQHSIHWPAIARPISAITLRGTP